MINMNKKLKSKLSIFCILIHYFISILWNHSLLSYYPHGVRVGAGAGVTENRVGQKLLFWKKNSEKKKCLDPDPYGSLSFGRIRILVAPKTDQNHAKKEIKIVRKYMMKKSFLSIFSFFLLKVYFFIHFG